MARFEIGSTEYLSKLFDSLGNNFDQVAIAMLEEATPLLANEVKQNLPQEIKKYGQYVTIMKPEKDGGSWINRINFTGQTDRKYSPPLRNAELMAYWEYGASTVPPRSKGFLRRSVSKSKSKVRDKMAEVFEAKMEQLGK